MRPPLSRGRNGRAAGGRFAGGNAGGPGNPHAQRVAKFRSVLLQNVTQADLKAVARMLVEKAKAREPWAVRELLDRVLGKAQANEDVTAGAGDLPIKAFANVDLDRI